MKSKFLFSFLLQIFSSTKHKEKEEKQKKKLLSFFLVIVFSRNKQKFEEKENRPLRNRRGVDGDRRIGGLFRWSRHCMAMMRLRDWRVVRRRVGPDLHDSTIKIEIVRLWEREPIIRKKKNRFNGCDLIDQSINQWSW